MRISRILLISLFFAAMLSQTAFAQKVGGVVSPTVPTLVNKVTIMPYVTASLNLLSGKAFSANATGVGFGGGLTFDLTEDGQKAGLLFDFAFQDMRGLARNGSCVQPAANDSLLEPADAYHYWEYVMFEPFLKIQANSKRNGYFLLGASFGFAILSETVSRGTHSTEYILWSGSPYSNLFRLDLRAGLGVELASIGTHKLVLEMRAGYPLTNVISDYNNRCGDGEPGNWRIITFQANLGVRI
jgi:hypothetical protein